MWLSTQRLKMQVDATQQEQKDASVAVIMFHANDLIQLPLGMCTLASQIFCHSAPVCS